MVRVCAHGFEFVIKKSNNKVNQHLNSLCLFFMFGKHHNVIIKMLTNTINE